MNGAAADPLAVMLEARSVALVGASPRPGSLGARMIEEVAKSASAPRPYLVNPRYAEIGGVRCHPTLDDLPEAVDLALLAVPDGALEQQLKSAAEARAGSAVIFGSAVDQDTPHRDPPDRDAVDTRGRSGAAAGSTLRSRIAALARDAGMPVCGAGCMGFVNVARGLRAIGYTEPDPLPVGPVALVTHSGSVFSALLRTRRAFGFTVAVSSGQELVTPAAAYASYALTLPETKVLALVLEAIRDGARLRSVLADAAARGVPVVLLAAGTSAASRSLVAAHSGALAAGDGAWQALASAHGVHRVGDLAELADTLELFCAGRRAWAGADRRLRGLATVHDSGFERAHVADVAASVGVPFARLTDETRERLAAVLDPGLEPGNPLDVWGTGRDSEELFTETLSALADDANVGAVALAVDLVPEYDGDDSYRRAVLAAAATTDKPVVVLASVPAAIDADAATRLRAAGVPVLESTRSGLLALGHLLAHTAPRHAAPEPPTRPPPTPPTARRPRRRPTPPSPTRPPPQPRPSHAPRPRPPLRSMRAGRAGRRPWRPARSAAPTSSTCSATTACRPSARARPARWRRRPRPPPRSATRLRSRPTSPASPISQTQAACTSTSPTRPPWPPPTRTSPRGSAPASSSAKWRRRGPSSSSAWPATRPSARSSSSAPGECWRSTWPSARSRFPRCLRPMPRG